MSIATVGSEILVSAGVGDNVYGSEVVKLLGGGFVVAWMDFSRTGDDTSGFAVRAQVFAADGSMSGPQVLVNTITASDQTNPKVAALSNGGFVVTWADVSGTGGDTSGGVRAQVFFADGSASGGEFLVNTTTSSQQHTPQIAPLSGGGFVVVWQDNSGTGGDMSGSSVRGQVFAAGGAPVGTEFLANTTTQADQSFQDVTALTNGGFVVSWRDLSNTGGDTSIAAVRVQVFAADGTKVGTEILANTATANGQDVPEITALTGGGFLVLWEDKSLTAPDTSVNAIRAQVFAADGSKVGTEILVNTATQNEQFLTGFTALINGGFVITWQDESQGVGGATGDAASSAVKAQVFATDGTKVGTEILVNTTTAGGQTSPKVAALPGSGFVIAWTDQSHTGGDTSDGAVRAQAFAADGTRVGTEVLVNTTTANFQGSPQLAALAQGFVVTWLHAPDDESGGAVRAQVFSSTSPNAAPEGADAARSVEYGATQVLSASDFGFSDGDGNSLSAVKITTLPALGVLKDNGVAVTAGQSVSVADIAAGKLMFVSSGSGAASFTFQVQDNGGVAGGGVDLDPTPNTLTLNIAAPPPPPAAPITSGSEGTGGSDVVILGSETNAFHAGAGADVVSAGDGDDAVYGDEGRDTMSGADGADTVYGGADNDLLTGDQGNDYLRGETGDDSIAGGTGFDDINGNEGNDTLSGGDGDDWVLGGKNDDTLTGDAGDDLVYGNLGRDTQDGGAGADTLRGGQDADLVLGGDGNDWLSGDRGSDTLTGGAGADIFHAFGEAGLDVVTDFHASEGDRVYLLPGTTYTTAQVGADTVISMTGGAQMILQNVQLSSLATGWIFGA